MIIYHHDNIAAFSGGHTFYWLFQAIMQSRVTITSAAPAPAEQVYQMMI
jgi:hypothetical protein